MELDWLIITDIFFFSGMCNTSFESKERRLIKNGDAKHYNGYFRSKSQNV